MKYSYIFKTLLCTCLIIIKSFYSLWSIGHPWRVSRHYGLQLSPWPRSMIFLLVISSSLVLRHVLFSLPLLLYPWGFQSNLVFSIAPVSLHNVCPIQFCFLLFIWFSIDFWCVILHSSSFVILPVHFIFIIRKLGGSGYVKTQGQLRFDVPTPS